MSPVGHKNVYRANDVLCHRTITYRANVVIYEQLSKWLIEQMELGQMAIEQMELEQML